MGCPFHGKTKEQSVSPIAALSQASPEDGLLALQTGNRTIIEHQGHASDDCLSDAFGFMPATTPLTALPASHALWDEQAAQIPAMLRLHTAHQQLTTLPILDASASQLPAHYLRRAALVMGALAHAYVRDSERRINHQRGFVTNAETELGKNIPLPPPILTPWKQICRRLGRLGPAYTFDDCMVYNWKLKQHTSGGQTFDPMKLNIEDLSVNVPMYGTPTEARFLHVMTLTVAKTSYLIGAIGKALQAVQDNRFEVLEETLDAVTASMQDNSFGTFQQIDPMTFSQTHVNPLLWSKTFAAFPAPIIEGEVGLSGGGALIFALLDAFLGRPNFDSTLAHELEAILAWVPPLQRRFMASVAKFDFPGLIHKNGSASLRNRFQSALDAYAGRRGWLGMHRLKVYGFIEVAFKAGRTETNGGFSGKVEKRAWESLDDDLDEARTERLGMRSNYLHRARRELVERVDTHTNADSGTYRVVVNLGQGLHVQAGDRLGIWPRNSRASCQRAMVALRANATENILLTAKWQKHLQRILQEDTLRKSVPLHLFLTYARLRPVQRDTLKILYKLTRAPNLKQILFSRSEDRYELDEVLRMVDAGPYDIRRLLRAQPWEVDSLAALVEPENERIYSISALDRSTDELRVELLVGLLTFTDQIDGKQVERRGVCSHFLVSEPQEELAPFPVEVVRPTRFKLPKQSSQPIVMFAGGTGLSPFRAFIQQRRSDPKAGETWLILAVRDETAIPCFHELREAAADGIQIRIVLSREDRRWQNSLQNEHGEWLATTRGYIDNLLHDTTQNSALQRLLTEDNAAFYICGRTTFAHTVHGMLQCLFEQTHPKQSKQQFQQLLAHQRLQQDIFTTFAPSSGPGVLGSTTYDTSEIAMANQLGKRSLMVIRGNVYDMEEFIELHPGGAQIICANLGLDATRAYEKVEHHLNAEVHAMTDLYKVGQVRRLDFGDHWGVVLSPKGVHTVTLHSLFRSWVRALYEVVELENTWNNNIELRDLALTEAYTGPSALRDSLILEVHQKLTQQLGQIIDGSLQYLWAITVGLCDPQQPYDALTRDIDDLRGSPDGIMARAVTVECLAMLERTRAQQQVNGDLSALLNQIVAVDSKALSEIKQILCDGVRLFEAHQAHVLQYAGIELVQTLRRLPAMLARFQRRLANTML